MIAKKKKVSSSCSKHFRMDMYGANVYEMFSFGIMFQGLNALHRQIIVIP